MANAFMDSMSNYDTVAKLLTKWDGPTFNSTFAVGAPYAISTAPQGIRMVGSGLTKNIPSQAQYFLGIRMKMVNPSSGAGMFQLLDAGSPHIILDWLVSGVWQARRGSTVLAASTLTIAPGSTHMFEMNIFIHPSAGWVYFYVDTVLFFSITGINTQNSSHAYANQFLVYAGGNGQEVWLNDCYINDNNGVANNGNEGDVKINSYKMTAAGSYAQFSRGGVDLGSNVLQINKTFADPTNINLSNVLNQRDSFLPAPVPAGTIKGARLWAYNQKDNIGARQVGLTVKNTVDDIGPGQLASGPGYNWLSRAASLDPSTGALWASLAAFNASEFGYKLLV